MCGGPSASEQERLGAKDKPYFPARHMPGEAGGRGSPAACLAAVRRAGRHCFTGVVIVLGKSLASCVFKLFTSATPHSGTLFVRQMS